MHGALAPPPPCPRRAGAVCRARKYGKDANNLPPGGLAPATADSFLRFGQLLGLSERQAAQALRSAPVVVRAAASSSPALCPATHTSPQDEASLPEPVRALSASIGAPKREAPPPPLPTREQFAAMLVGSGCRPLKQRVGDAGPRPVGKAAPRRSGVWEPTGDAGTAGVDARRRSVRGKAAEVEVARQPQTTATLYGWPTPLPAADFAAYAAAAAAADAEALANGFDVDLVKGAAPYMRPTRPGLVRLVFSKKDKRGAAADGGASSAAGTKKRVQW